MALGFLIEVLDESCFVMNSIAHTRLSEAHGPSADQTHKTPGHWLLASLGKRVLRPGGLELTRAMLDQLNIQSNDAVVEFAPGLGVTARLTLARLPDTYTAVERDETAAAEVRRYLKGGRQTCRVAVAEQTGLPDASATVVYGEAMLTMQGPEQKLRIVSEAYRLLKMGGRYGIHELSLTPDDLPELVQEDISREMSRNIHVGARPLTARGWRALLEGVGFKIQSEATAPMHLLEAHRLFRDEGFLRALKFLLNVARRPAARNRVCSMRRLFRKHRQHLAAVAFIAVKP